MLNMERFGFYKQINLFWNLGIKLRELIIQGKGFEKIINSNKQQFDVIIASALFHDCDFLFLLYVRYTNH